MPLRSVSERLPFEALKSISKNLDDNKNNRIDRDEVGFDTHRALREASCDKEGYCNDIVGTTEMAKALERDAVTLRNLPPAVADKVANALTNGDAWLARGDFSLTEAARDRIDTNGDGRVARHELSSALQNGDLEIGSTLKMFERDYAPPPRPYEPPYTPPPYTPSEPRVAPSNSP